MSFEWLTPVRRALDERSTPLPLFVRNDDAGWADERLEALLHVVGEAGCVVDLAVIPIELDAARADWLLDRWRRGAGRVRLHQHGWAHENHERDGRRSEFGLSRSLEDVRLDVARGRAWMRARLGEALDPVFTPPWNRCRPELGAILLQEGVAVLSRDRTADVLDVPGLGECPVTVDWFGRRGGVRLTRREWAEALGRTLRDDSYAGLMLHHAVTDADELRHVGALLRLLAGHPHVRCLPLVEAAAQVPRAPIAATAARASGRMP